MPNKSRIHINPPSLSQVLDQRGVGQLIVIATDRGRKSRPNLKVTHYSYFIHQLLYTCALKNNIIVLRIISIKITSVCTCESNSMIMYSCACSHVGWSLWRAWRWAIVCGIFCDDWSRLRLMLSIQVLPIVFYYTQLGTVFFVNTFGWFWIMKLHLWWTGLLLQAGIYWFLNLPFFTTVGNDDWCRVPIARLAAAQAATKQWRLRTWPDLGFQNSIFGDMALVARLKV